MKLPPALRKVSARQSTGGHSSHSESAPIVPQAVDTPLSHPSLPIRIHNRTSLDLLAVSVVAALASSKTVTSSSINAYTTNVPTRNTPVPVAPCTFTDLPQMELEPATAASSNGYVITLTILARGAPTSTSLSASISAMAPTTDTSVAPSTSARRWKKLDLSSSTNSVQEKTSSLSTVSALQSIPTSASDPIQILVLPTRDTQSWMSTLSDGLLLSALCIPGTHESCALFGWPISACQESSSSVSDQLNKGIRFLDIRLALKNGQLSAYHGVQDEKSTFTAILDQVYAFLAQQPRETVIMSVKQENAAAGFAEVVMNQYVTPAAGKWYTGTRIPTLAQARGKIVLFARFGSANGQPGITPPIWPDSSPTTFAYDLPDSLNEPRQSVVTQDWYNISSLSAIPTKVSLIKTLIDQCGEKPNILGLNFTNASSFPLALPAFAAKGVGSQTTTPGGKKSCWQVTGINALLLDLVADRLQAQTGTNMGASSLMTVFATDFFDQAGLGADLTRLLIEANFS